MQLSLIAFALAAAVPMISASPVNAGPTANLPGLNAIQSKYAQAIIGRAKSDGVGAHGCQAAIATALVEVSPFDSREASPHRTRTTMLTLSLSRAL